uniref:Uncharacterized protein n=1 Tax=Glossina austeni TaxID=7395 RepID=A0A1A9UEF7_GLOAU
MAIVRLFSKLAADLLQEARIKIGRTVSTMLHVTLPVRCFKCLECGCIARVCKSKLDMSQCGLNCHKSGQKGKECKNDHECTTCSGKGLRKSLPMRNCHELCITWTIKYLHINAACAKAERLHAALARIMATIGGPSQKRQLLLGKVILAVLVDAAPVWGHSLRRSIYVKITEKLIQTTALSIRCGFRTMSLDAASYHACYHQI